MAPQIITSGAGSLIFFLLVLVLSAFFLWIGTKLAGIHHASMGKSLIVAVVSMVVLAVLNAVLSVVRFFGGILGFFLGILVTVFIIKVVFNTSWSKALLAWVLYIVAVILAFAVTGVLGLALYF